MLQQNRPIELQVVEGAKAILEFSEQWDDLFDRAKDASPYLSRSWSGTFIEQGRLRGNALAILAWCETKLVALFPLAVRTCLNTRIAEPIGTGQPSYLGLLLDPDYPEVIDFMTDAIRTKKIANVLCIEDLWSGDKATEAFLTSLARKNFSVRRVYRNPCPFIHLGCSYEEYMKKNKSAKSQQTLRRKERQFRKRHAVDIEHYEGSEITTNIIHRIASIQEQSWMKRRGAAVLGQPFYRKLLSAIAHSGLARVWLMKIDDCDAAFVFALVAHKKLYYAWTAFKLEYASSLSIGQFLTNWTIRDACQDGILMYDFEHGEAEYKRFWANDHFDVNRVSAGQGLRGRLMAVYYYVIWRLGKLEWLRSLRHRQKRLLLGFKQKVTSL
jgi:CelD/BcsL family acetyltransferase involved in cellulose biosynthesis